MSSQATAARRRGRIAAVVIVLALPLSACGTTVDPPPLDAEALLAQASEDRRARLLEQFPGLEIPDVELVRTVSITEWPDIQAACLREAGYRVDVTTDGGVAVSDLPLDQREAYQLASFICAEQYPLDAAYLAPLDAAQLRSIYDYQTGELTECLRNRGFEVPAKPTFEVFADGYRTGTAWSPYRDVSVDSNEEWGELNEACPQLPADLYG